jgi:hypothetical protein
MAEVLNNFYPDWLQNRLYDELKTHPFNFFWNNGLGSNFWNYQITDEDNAVTRLSNKFLEEFIKKFDGDVGDIGRCYINLQTSGLEPGPHYDYSSPDGVTVINYITDSWNISWGGETVLFDHYSVDVDYKDYIQETMNQPLSIEKAVLPAYNRVLLIPAHQLHVARPLSRFYIGVRYTLMYKLSGITIPELMSKLK